MTEFLLVVCLSFKVVKPFRCVIISLFAFEVGRSHSVHYSAARGGGGVGSPCTVSGYGVMYCAMFRRDVDFVLDWFYNWSIYCFSPVIKLLD